jgi:hypothetical protein
MTEGGTSHSISLGQPVYTKTQAVTTMSGGLIVGRGSLDFGKRTPRLRERFAIGDLTDIVP